MSKNYDNWERLVRAVLRSENDRRIALLHSSTHSSSNSTSSSFDRSFGPANFQILDHDQSQERSRLVMNYTDLGLDHSQWKTMLPPGKNELLWSSAYSLNFSVDKKNRKNCFLLGASTSGTSSRDAIEFISRHPNSRFSEVVELTDSVGVEIHCRIKAQVFSPDTLYAAYLVFDSKNDNNQKPRKAISIVRIVHRKLDYGYSIERGRIVNFENGDSRSDGWMEIHLGEFYVGEVNSNGDVLVQLLETTGYFVEGIEFRPLKKKKNKREKGIFSNIRIY
ncbi:hypothetical protein ABFX02_07G063500 [Erythranthe guttata]